MGFVLELYERFKSVWLFLAGVLTTLVLVYGKPLRVRGKLFQPDYQAALDVVGEPDFVGWAMELPVRITNTGKKAITPISFYGAGAENAPPVEIPVAHGQRAALGKQIESLHTLNVTLHFGQLNEREGAITAVYFVDVLGYKCYLPQAQYTAACQSFQAQKQKVLAFFRERKRKVEEEREGLDKPVGFEDVRITDLKGVGIIVGVATNRTAEDIRLTECKIDGIRGHDHSISLDIVQLDELVLSPNVPTRISFSLKIAPEERTNISAIYFYDDRRRYLPISHNELLRLKERL